ncbi:hypothetical protein IJG72_07210 [bacterium]|nr:hypothetical protein [bacterium]
MKKCKNSLIKIVIILIFNCLLLAFCFTEPLDIGLDNKKEKYKEADYVNKYCNGKIEYILKDKTRIDCLTDEYAIEFDWGKKWAEGIGQALYYSKMTGKKPAVALIIKSPSENKYAERIKIVDKNIKVFVIKANDYKDK